MVLMNETGFLDSHNLSEVSYDENSLNDVAKMETVEKVFRHILEINDILKQIEPEDE